MASLTDPAVARLLQAPHCAVISTLNPDGSVLDAVVWISLQDGELAVNSARGRRWPSNLDRDPRITVLVYDPANPYEYVEIRGTTAATTDGAVDHIHQLSKLYTGNDEYPLQPGEERVKYVITPERVRSVKA